MPHQQNRLDVQIPASFLPHLVAISFPFTKRLELKRLLNVTGLSVWYIFFSSVLCSAKGLLLLWPI